MITPQVLLVRVVSVTAVAVAAAVSVCTVELGRSAVADAPVLADLRAPLDVAAAAGAVLTVSLAGLAWAWSSLLVSGQRSSQRAVALLGRLRAGVTALGLYLVVCTVGMGSVLDGYGLGMPGVWLAAVVAEGVLAAVLLTLAHQHREARTEFACAHRNGVPATTR